MDYKEYIKIVDISENTRGKFMPLIPEEKRQLLDRVGCFALGAVFDNKRQAIPVGVIIFSVESLRPVDDDYLCDIRLHWIYVSEMHRNLGIGSSLYQVFLSSVPAPARVTVMCPVSDTYDDICSFLMACGFEFRLEELFEVTLSVLEIVSNSRLASLPKETVGVVPLRDIDTGSWYGLSEYLMSQGLSAAKRDYDEGLSALLIKDEKPVAAVLFDNNISGELCPVFFGPLPGGDVKLLDPLLSYVMDRIMDLPGDVCIKVRPRSAVSGELIDRFFPGKAPAIVRTGHLYMYT